MYVKQQQGHRKQVSTTVEREKQIEDMYGDMVSTRPSANLNKIGVGIGIVLMILALIMKSIRLFFSLIFPIR